MLLRTDHARTLLPRAHRARAGPRVLVTDVEHRAGLATVRCLRDAGYDVTAVGSSRLAPGLWSGASARRRIAPDPEHAHERFVARLEKIVRTQRHELLIAGTDASLLAISRARQRLSQYVRLGLPEPRLVDGALDKVHVGREAAKVGLLSPAARVCHSSQEAIAAARSFGYPVLVKPRQTVLDLGAALDRRASQLASDGSGVEAAANRFGTCIVQERVQAPVISFGGVIANRRLRALAVSRYARTWPPQSGNASFSETIEPPASLVQRVERLVSALGWEGMFELELLECGDGYGAIDFNPRPYGSLALAVAAGAPLPAIWCDLVLGHPGPVAAAREGVRYRWEDAELRHVTRLLRAGQVRPALTVLGAQRDVTNAYFQLRDPAPWLGRVAELTRTAAARSTRRRSRRAAGPATRSEGPSRTGEQREPARSGAMALAGQQRK